MSKDKETKKEEVNENIENVNENVSTEECDNRQEAELSIEEKLQKELDEANEKIANLEDKYLRQVAEFDNYRKRTIKEKS